jgi:hypothetical protein
MAVGVAPVTVYVLTVTPGPKNDALTTAAADTGADASLAVGAVDIHAGLGSATASRTETEIGATPPEASTTSAPEMGSSAGEMLLARSLAIALTPRTTAKSIAASV